MECRSFLMNQRLGALMCLSSSLDMPVVSKILKMVLLVTRQLWYTGTQRLSSFFIFSFVFNSCDSLSKQTWGLEHSLTRIIEKDGTKISINMNFKFVGKWIRMGNEILNIIFLQRKNRSKAHKFSVQKSLSSEYLMFAEIWL